MKDFQIQGVNHIALVCKDMARTVDFYTNVLGLNLIKTIVLPDGGQHFFADVPSGVVSEPDETTFISSIYFYDPDGIMLEFAANLRDLGDPDRDIQHQPATATSSSEN
jgi:catechol 2,3-dioxygenase-like lactoylglutathione lyase family enzyme